MKSVGEILKTERNKQGETLDQVSRETKIPLPTLESLEKDDYRSLPPATFVKGFIRNYACYLNLDPDKVLAVFRRDYESSKKGKILPKGMTKPLDQGFSWSPKITIVLFSVFVLTVLIAFLFLQVRSYLFAPSLAISSPKEGKKINKLVVEVRGKTIPDATVFVNEQLISVEFDGSFLYSLKLLPGENLIRIKAVNRRGKEKEVKRRVVVDKQE